MNQRTLFAPKPGVLLLVVLLFFAVLPAASGPWALAQSTSDALIIKTDIQEEAVLGNNGVYEKVTLSVPFNVQVDGEYIVYANAKPAGLDWDYSSTSAMYKSGLNSVSFDIPGKQIFDSKMNGPYDIELSVLNSAGEPQDSETYTTKAYSYEDFNTTKLSQDIPDIEQDAGWFILRFDTLTAEISKTSPIVNYYYTDDDGGGDGEEGRYSKAVLKITRIITFDDSNADGVPQDEEIKFRGNLLNHYWDYSIRYDQVYEIRLNADVILKDKDFKPGPRLDVTFTYHADETKLSDQAVTMEIQTSEPLAGTHLCVEASMTDGSEEGEREFVFDNAAENRAAFWGPKDKEQNYVHWQKKCTVEEESGPLQKDCLFETEEGADGHLIYSTTGISTYTVGVTTGFSFGVTGEYTQPPGDYEHNVWIYFLGIALAVVIVVASFMLQRKFSKKEVL